MAANRNTKEKHLQLLNERYLLLLIKLQTMGREIQALGGNLPEISAMGLYDGLIDNQQDLKEKTKLFDNEWVDEVITTMDTLSRPCTIKELTELIYSKDNRYSMSTIHINVTRTIRLLNKTKLVERYNNCAQKYILRKFF